MREQCMGCIAVKAEVVLGRQNKVVVLLYDWRHCKSGRFRCACHMIPENLLSIEPIQRACYFPRKG